MFPWTVFGIVTIRFKPSTITIAHIWAATKVEESVEGDERVLVVELGHKSQDDFTFSVDGLGGPIKSTKLACQQTEATPSDCGLEPVFTVLNNYDGVISPNDMRAALAGFGVTLTEREVDQVSRALRLPSHPRKHPPCCR